MSQDHSHDQPDLGALRREYGDRGLDIPDLAPDPIDDVPAVARRHGGRGAARAERDGGRPRSPPRAVRPPGWCCSRGSTSAASCSSPTTSPARAREIEANPAVSLLFPWHDLQRQVRVEGTASRVSREESEAYFAQPAARVAAGRLGLAAVPAWSRRAPPSTRGTAACWRSSPTLDDVPVPPQWGGFRVAPEEVEFWQGRKGRMHDRLVYRRAEQERGRRGRCSAWRRELRGPQIPRGPRELCRPPPLQRWGCACFPGGPGNLSTGNHL